MRILIPALCAALVLAGCQTTVTKVDDAIQKNLPLACNMIATAHAGFIAIEATHPLSASVVKKEAVAYAASGPICADPTKVTTANALVVAANVYAAIAAALREAQAAGG